MHTEKIVDFFKYCSTCKYFTRSEWEPPCDECVELPARVDSHKPEYYEEEKDGHKKT